LHDKQDIAEEQLKLQLVSKVKASANVAAPIQTMLKCNPKLPNKWETSTCYILVYRSRRRQEEGWTMCPTVRKDIVPLSIGGEVCPADFPERFSISCILEV